MIRGHGIASGAIGAAFAGVLWAGLIGCAEDVPDPPNVIIISLDTVRRDHLPTYGYPRPTAPFVDSLARDALVFDRAFAQETNTNPSHTSMFTGLYPPAHGSVANGVRLGADQTVLAQVLSAAGYRTGGFVSGATLQERASGLSRGFDRYDDEFPGLRRDGMETVERARRWLAEERAERPFFLFVHLYDAHGPYLPPAEYAGLFRSAEDGPWIERIPDYQRVPDENGRLVHHANWYVDRYDAMIRYEDDCVRRLLDDLDLERSIVVVLSDHGETFHERYGSLGHGAEVNDEQTRIPLLIRVPGLQAKRRDDLTETVDLLPTLTDLLGLPPNPDVQGHSLATSNEDSGDREFVFASARPADSHYADRGYRLDRARRIHSIRSEQWKLILLPGRETDYVELYDLGADPGEQSDVAAAHPELRDELRSRLAAWAELRGVAGPVPATMDPAVLDKLQSLGYVGD